MGSSYLTGIASGPLHWQLGVLATEPPEKLFVELIVDVGKYSNMLTLQNIVKEKIKYKEAEKKKMKSTSNHCNQHHVIK